MDIGTKNNILVSIGLPTYNRPKNLEEAIANLQRQTHKNIEIIISDNDSSNPDVKKIIKKYAADDQRIKAYYQDNNIGVIRNASFVLSQAKGKYFMWCSDDDWRSPQAIDILLESLEENPQLNTAISDFIQVDECGAISKIYPKNRKKLFHAFTSNYSIYRTISHYLQDNFNGKSNIFYALFRTDFIKRIDLNKISSGYTSMSMDKMISYEAVKDNRILFHQEKLLSLTVGNKKDYKIRNLGDKKKLYEFNKLATIILYEIYEYIEYIKNTEKYFTKSFITILFPVKLFYIIFKKILLALKNDDNNFQINDFNIKKNLNNVTLLAVATKEVDETLMALRYSSIGINFKEVKLISHYEPFDIPANIEHIKINKFLTMDDWCKSIVYDLYKYVKTDYVILIHADGFIVNPDQWTDDFLDYDFIGAPWPIPKDGYSYRDELGNIIRVGNSVSLRSRALLELPTILKLQWESDAGYFHEDGFICVKNRHILSENGIRFADLNIAKYFSHEIMIPELEGIKPFAFHKWAGTNKIYPKF